MSNRNRFNQKAPNQTMPSPSMPSQVVPAETAPDLKFPGRPTLLYVDDNLRSSRLLASVLEDCGFRVIARNDPVEALVLCRHTYFDLALLDYEMPAMNGARMAREIKFLAPDVPVVLISSRTELPPAELEFVDAHFGFATDLDDLLWSLRILSRSQLVHAKLATHELCVPLDSGSMTESRWADST